MWVLHGYCRWPRHVFRYKKGRYLGKKGIFLGIISVKRYFPCAYAMSEGKALKEDAARTREAAAAEAANLVKHDSLEPASWGDARARQAALRSLTNYKWKTDTVAERGPDGRTHIKEVPSVLKARTCIDGSSESVRDLGPEDRTAPTARTESTKLMVATAAAMGWGLGSADVKSAYLHAKMPADRDRWVRFSKTMTDALTKAKPEWSRGTHINDRGEGLFKIKRGIYGLIESGSLWRRDLVETLDKAGYRPIVRDPCVFVKRGPRGPVALVSTHVDDLLHAGLRGEREALWEHLRERYGEVTAKDGPVLKYVGLEITIGSAEFLLTQQAAIEAIYKKYPDASKGRDVTSPMAVDTDLLDEDRSDAPSDPKAERELASAAMELMYVATQTRPDISFATMVLSTLIKHARPGDMPSVMRVIKYLHQRKGLGLRFRREGRRTFDVSAEADASHLAHHDSKGTSGYSVSVNGSRVLWRSRKQKIVTRSSSETELVSLNELVAELVWVVEWLHETGLRDKDACGPVRVAQDNMSTMLLAARGVGGHGNTRHMDSKLNYVKQLVDARTIVLVYTPTDELSADLLTKPLSGSVFETHAKSFVYFCGRGDGPGSRPTACGGCGVCEVVWGS